MKNRYTQLRVSILFIFLTLLFCWLFCGKYGVFGSKVDWISQHSVFPDYFRQQFYDTGDFFPEFALDIGGGQNIYHFAYYGLYSPVFWLSYLLPFVKMSDYLIAASFVCLTASIRRKRRKQRYNAFVSFDSFYQTFCGFVSPVWHWSDHTGCDSFACRNYMETKRRADSCMGVDFHFDDTFIFVSPQWWIIHPG